MEDVRRLKTTFNGRQAWMEDGLRQKKTLDGRRPLMEEDLLWKTTFDGGQPLMEKYLRLNHSNKNPHLNHVIKHIMICSILEELGVFLSTKSALRCLVIGILLSMIIYKSYITTYLIVVMVKLWLYMVIGIFTSYQ